MKDVKIVKSKFDFLIDRGFIYSYNKKESNIGFSLNYRKGNIIIKPSYDYVEDDFDVYLFDTKYEGFFNFGVSILDAEIGTTNSRKKLKEAVQNLLIESKNGRGIRKKEFETITTLYANFVKENLDEILNWKKPIDRTCSIYFFNGQWELWHEGLFVGAYGTRSEAEAVADYHGWILLNGRRG